MNLGVVTQAAELFAVTHIADILLLSLFFAQSAGHRGSARRITLASTPVSPPSWPSPSPSPRRWAPLSCPSRPSRISDCSSSPWA